MRSRDARQISQRRAITAGIIIHGRQGEVGKMDSGVNVGGGQYMLGLQKRLMLQKPVR